MAVQDHFWVCARCATPNAAGLPRCRACDAQRADPHPQPGVPVSPLRQPRPGDGSGLWPARDSLPYAPGQPVVRCPRCGTTTPLAIGICSRCGKELPTTGTTTPASRTGGIDPTRPRSRRRPLLALVLVVTVVAAVAAMLSTAGGPHQALVAVPATPTPSVRSDGQEPRVTAGTSTMASTRSLTGVLIIVDPEGSIEGSPTGRAESGRGSTAPWVPVNAELEDPRAQGSSSGPESGEAAGVSRQGACVGAAEFRDFTQGRTVTLTNERAEVIATTALEDGTLGRSGSSYGCRFPFTFTSVPAAASYTIDVGRGALTYSRAQLDALDWTVEFEVGPRS